MEKLKKIPTDLFWESIKEKVENDIEYRDVDGWDEEMEKRYWAEQIPLPYETPKNPKEMKVNYAVVFADVVGGNEMKIKHICVYQNEPDQSDIDLLVSELAVEEEFGMVGDTDYKIYKFDRSVLEHNEFMSVELGLPEEIDGTEGL